jgi:uncharacterized membrane protein
MKVPVALLTLTLFLLVGCAPGPTHFWYHPDKTLKQAKEDCRACQSRAEDEAGEMVAEEERRQLRSESRSSDDGWKFYDEQVKSRSSVGTLYKKNVFDGCMQGRGYVKVKDYRLPSNLRTKSCSMGAVAGR